MKKPQKKLHYHGKVVTLKLDGFDHTQPLVVVNLRNNDSLIINLQGIPPEAVDKETVMRKAHILTEDFGQLRLIASRLQNHHELTGREITVNDVVFQEANFETNHELVTAFVPKDLYAKPKPVDTNAPVKQAPAFQADESHPVLYGMLLGRHISHIKTTDGDYRLLIGPVAA